MSKKPDNLTSGGKYTKEGIAYAKAHGRLANELTHLIQDQILIGDEFQDFRFGTDQEQVQKYLDNLVAAGSGMEDMPGYSRIKSGTGHAEQMLDRIDRKYIDVSKVRVPVDDIRAVKHPKHSISIASSPDSPFSANDVASHSEYTKTGTADSLNFLEERQSSVNDQIVLLSKLGKEANSRRDQRIDLRMRNRASGMVPNFEDQVFKPLKGSYPWMNPKNLGGQSQFNELMQKQALLFNYSMNKNPNWQKTIEQYKSRYDQVSNHEKFAKELGVPMRMLADQLM